MAHLRTQQTIKHPVEVQGRGLFTGNPVHLRFLPAVEGHGVQFLRVDLPGSLPIPALLDYCIFRERRTAIERAGAVVELTEHVLAALAGLQIDNCLIEIDAPEAPGCDGSAKPFVDALLTAEIVKQQTPKLALVITEEVQVQCKQTGAFLVATPAENHELTIEYELDYGTSAPFPAQSVKYTLSPEVFTSEISMARTFILEQEIRQLQAAGYGSGVTAQELIVFRDDGSILDNSLHTPDEPARHKLLDCIGDFALSGTDIIGNIKATRSGHALNRKLIQQLHSNKNALWLKSA